MQMHFSRSPKPPIIEIEDNATSFNITMNNIEKHSKIVEYIKQYEGLWCGTNFRGYYLVISADDLWDHYFCKEEEATEKYLKDFEAKGMYAIKYVIGSKIY